MSTRLLILIACGALVAQPTRGGGGGAEGDRGAGPSPKVLTVCAVPTAMPRTGRDPDGTPRGLDLAIIERVGRALGRTIEFHWCANAGCAWNCLPDGRCDIVVGQPFASGPPRGVAWSVPYAGARFGLVVPREAPDVRSLADLQGKRVGIVTGTVAISEKDHAVARFQTREELLDRFETTKLDAGFLDADFAAWYLHEHPKLGLRLVADFVPRERWNMAMAMRANDAELLVEINRALAELAQVGALRTIYDDLGVPFHSPFTESARRELSPETWRRVLARGELIVSMDPANLPYSSARDERPGLDVELARVLAGRLGVKLRIDWLDVQRETAIGALLQRECDLVFGAAVDPGAVADDEELAGKVLYSRPYYATGYLLVHRKGGPVVRSLAALKGSRSDRIGTEAGSIADYRLRQRGHLRRLFRNQLATLKALEDGDIDYAYLWSNVGWTLAASPDLKLEIVPDFAPEDRWNMAVALRQGDIELKRHVDEALGAMIRDGTVSRTLERYHVPDLGPSPEPAGGVQGSVEGVIRHEVANRGREPQLQRIQTSRHPYGGLARVRSAGELVVGLDQNNLPFSKAHPTPSGLDYEIAGLLAEQLGVSLRVYWAYSTHDSYPSKLATRRLCDVILGVMPDDRFAERVLYSRPYHVASYRVVVRSGAAPPSDREALAVEEGVAVRGLQGREVRPYPSLDAILEAVVSGKAEAGYVISTRGPWLAEQRWPGKLVFLPETASVDRFPICATVRKSDRDLKEEIDRAWAELERSGRLAQVFARWQIPHAPASNPEAEKERTR